MSEVERFQTDQGSVVKASDYDALLDEVTLLRQALASHLVPPYMVDYSHHTTLAKIAFDQLILALNTFKDFGVAHEQAEQVKFHMDGIQEWLEAYEKQKHDR